jgi:hypothetical protein
MVKLQPAVQVAVAQRLDAHAGRRFQPVPFASLSRLNFKRLRQPTRLPTMHSSSLFGRYIDRLQWLFGGR